MQHCRNICKYFEGYHGGSGRNMYKEGRVFCKLCDCGYKSIDGHTVVYCYCCKAKVRHNTHRSYTRKSKLETIPRIG
jgi:hypothetical protein